MPSFLTHIDISKKVSKDISECIDLSYFLTYSLGCDLSKYSKCRKDTHHLKQEEFINNMLIYLKENNLTTNKIALSILYGHITHYLTDTTIHPLVYIISKNTKGDNKHTKIEFYYDYYFTNNHLSKKNPIITKIPKEIKNMLDYVYLKTYQVKHIHFYYKINLILYKYLYYLYKLLGFNFFLKLSKLEKYLNTNKNIDFLNNNHSLYQYSLEELSNLSIEKTLNYLKNLDL